MGPPGTGLPSVVATTMLIGDVGRVELHGDVEGEAAVDAGDRAADDGRDVDAGDLLRLVVAEA